MDKQVKLSVGFPVVCAVTALFCAVMMVGGCGGGGSSAPATVSATSSAISGATVNAGSGTVTTSASAPTVITAPAGAPAALTAVMVTLPANTTITAKNASGATIPLTSFPSFTFTASSNATATSSGTSGVPLPAVGGFSFVTSTSIAIDVQITGAASATFSNPVTITLPVPGKTPGTVVGEVYQNKNDGLGYKKLPGGPYTVSATGTVDIVVSDFCWFVGDPVFGSATGSSGLSGL